MTRARTWAAWVILVGSVFTACATIGFFLTSSALR